MHVDEFDHAPRLCIGCKQAGKKVGSKGPWDSPIVLLGEGPGVMELRKGQPFVGPSGDVIKEAWPNDLGFKYEDCFVLNAMQCFTASGSKDPSRMLNAVASCRERVYEMISMAPRKVILSFGKWANVSLFNDPDFKIMSRRGETLEWGMPVGSAALTQGCETVKVVPALHPAFLLRGQGNPNHFRSDVRKGVMLALGLRGGSGYEDPQPVQISTPEMLFRLIDMIKQEALERGGPLNLEGFDVETSGFNWRNDYLLCLGLHIEELGNYGWIIDWDRIRLEKQRGDSGNATLYALTKELLELPPSVLRYSWHNGKFDVKFLRTVGINARVDDDSFLMSYALDEKSSGHDLETVSKNLLDAKDYKDEIKQWVPTKKASYSNIPKPVLWQYLARDVKNTTGISHILREKVKEDANTEKLYTHTLIPASEMLARVEMKGIYVDMDYVECNRICYENDLEEAQQKISDLAGYWVNPNSPPQVSKLLFDDIGLTYKGKRPPDTSKEILDKIYEQTQHPILKAIRSYRGISKALSTYIKPLPDLRDYRGRVHTTFNLGRTSTGRLSSSEPNIQNIPRLAHLRAMYGSEPGKIVIENDYDTAELRMLAALSMDTELTDIFVTNRVNLHDKVSREMYGENFTGDQRIRAKAINFGIPYGREAFSIAEEFDITPQEAQRLIDTWFATFPGAENFIRRCREAPTKGLTLVNAFGRKRRPGVVAPELMKAMQNEFANFFMQSTISEFTLHSAMVLMGVDCGIKYDARVMKWFGFLPKIDACIVNLIHDALLTETLEKYRDEVIFAVAEVMSGVPRKWIDTEIIFSTEAKFGTNWGMLTKVKK